MKRRSFLKHTLAASAALSLGNWNLLANETHATQTTSPYKKSMMWGTVSMKGTVLEKCQAVKAAGFHGVEPNSHMDRKEMLDAMKSTGLVASSVCNAKHWESPMSSPDAAIRQKGIEEMIVAMEDAKAYGTDAVLLVPGRVDENVAYDEAWERSVECIKKLVPTAEKMKVNICIENVWNNFLLSPLEAARYVDQFNSNYVRFYFDIGNINPYGWPEQWIKILGNRIGRIHIKEFDKQKSEKEGKWKGFDPELGQGDINWTKVMASIREVGYKPWLTIEHKGGDSPEGLKKLSTQLDKYIAL